MIIDRTSFPAMTTILPRNSPPFLTSLPLKIALPQNRAPEHRNLQYLQFATKLLQQSLLLLLLLLIPTEQQQQSSHVHANLSPKRCSKPSSRHSSQAPPPPDFFHCHWGREPRVRQPAWGWFQGIEAGPNSWPLDRSRFMTWRGGNGADDHHNDNNNNNKNDDDDDEEDEEEEEERGGGFKSPSLQLCLSLALSIFLPKFRGFPPQI